MKVYTVTISSKYHVDQVDDVCTEQVFAKDSRIAIKRARQLMEDAGEKPSDYTYKASSK